MKMLLCVNIVLQTTSYAIYSLLLKPRCRRGVQRGLETFSLAGLDAYSTVECYTCGARMLDPESLWMICRHLPNTRSRVRVKLVSGRYTTRYIYGWQVDRQVGRQVGRQVRGRARCAAVELAPDGQRIDHVCLSMIDRAKTPSIRTAMHFVAQTPISCHSIQRQLGDRSATINLATVDSNLLPG